MVALTPGDLIHLPDVIRKNSAIPVTHRGVIYLFVLTVQDVFKKAMWRVHPGKVGDHSDVPTSVMLPRRRLAVNLALMGKRPDSRGTHVVRAVLADERGRPRAERKQDLADGDPLLLDTSEIEPGSYRLQVAVQTPDGAVVSQSEHVIQCLPGLF